MRGAALISVTARLAVLLNCLTGWSLNARITWFRDRLRYLSVLIDYYGQPPYPRICPFREAERAYCAARLKQLEQRRKDVTVV